MLQACKLCALHNELADNESHLRTFTSQSVRRGVGSTTYEVMRALLHQTNPPTGRSLGSTMNVQYADDRVILRPGPLFTDTADIQAGFDSYLKDVMHEYQVSILCCACGMPHCKCKRCVCLNVGGNSKKAHTCWIKEVKAAKPNRDGYPWPENYPQDMFSAWKNAGVEGRPVWVRTPGHMQNHSMGCFQWTENGEASEHPVWPAPNPRGTVLSVRPLQCHTDSGDEL